MRRSIRETIAGGIANVTELQEALHTAIQLEFSTLPPYLSAQWSVNSNNDPSDVADMVGGIAVQEMLHFGLGCNMLTAIGGTPNIANASFIPSYPTQGLPGGVQPGLVVDLLPLGPTALNTFMQIEFPEFGPVAMNPDTIGAFYDTIAAAFTTLNPTIVSTGLQVVTNIDQDSLFAITSVQDALNAIAIIQAQGEGTSSSPDEPALDGELAHYYTFASIYFGNELVQVDGKFSYTGASIQMPTVYPFSASSQQPDPSAQFNTTFSDLLRLLQQAWTVNVDQINPAITTMFTLKKQGVALIQAGIRPEFAWTTNSNLPAVRSTAA